MKKKVLFSLSIILFVVSCLNLQAHAADRRIVPVKKDLPSEIEKRSALVIGNSKYNNTSTLRNPENDAKKVAQTLRDLGFEVTEGINLSGNEMKRAIDDFGKRIMNSGVGLFYYAGHGVQVQGNNYLIPVDAKIETENDIEYESVNVGRILAKMEDARNRLNIVILDACRNNPFARSFRSASQGLAYMNAPGGTLIAYATAPGSVASDGPGENGVYTEELVKFMQQPNLVLEEVFKRTRVNVEERTGSKQIPWESTSVKGDFSFVPGIVPSQTAKIDEANKTIDVILEAGVFYEEKGKLQPLKDGMTLHSKDNYTIYLKPREDSYVYIFQVDTNGQAFKLFPNREEYHTSSNPLAANGIHWIPAKGKFFFLDNSVGKEEIVFFASNKPIESLEKVKISSKKVMEDTVKLMGVGGTTESKVSGKVANEDNTTPFDMEKIRINSDGNLVYKTWFWHK